MSACRRGSSSKSKRCDRTHPVEITTAGILGSWQVAGILGEGPLASIWSFAGFASFEVNTWLIPKPVDRYYNSTTREVIPLSGTPETINIDPLTMAAACTTGGGGEPEGGCGGGGGGGGGAGKIEDEGVGPPACSPPARRRRARAPTGGTEERLRSEGAAVSDRGRGPCPRAAGGRHIG